MKEESINLTVYSLVKFKPNVPTDNFIDNALKLPNVREAKLILGEYDAIVIFEGQNFRSLGLVAVKDLRSMVEVMSTNEMTCP